MLLSAQNHMCGIIFMTSPCCLLALLPEVWLQRMLWVLGQVLSPAHSLLHSPIHKRYGRGKWELSVMH